MRRLSWDTALLYLRVARDGENRRLRGIGFLLGCEFKDENGSVDLKSDAARIARYGEEGAKKVKAQEELWARMKAERNEK